MFSWVVERVYGLKWVKVPFIVRIFRSSCPEMFCEKGVLRNFSKFTGKHLCQSLFFNNVAGLRPATLLKKSLWHRCFPMNFVKFLRTPFFYRRPLVAAYEFCARFVASICLSKVNSGSSEEKKEKRFINAAFDTKTRFTWYCRLFRNIEMYQRSCLLNLTV